MWLIALNEGVRNLIGYGIFEGENKIIGYWFVHEKDVRKVGGWCILLKPLRTMLVRHSYKTHSQSTEEWRFIFLAERNVHFHVFLVKMASLSGGSKAGLMTQVVLTYAFLTTTNVQNKLSVKYFIPKVSWVQRLTQPKLQKMEEKKIPLSKLNGGAR